MLSHANESEIGSTPEPTYLLCNPHLQTFDRLFEVNSMKDLKLCDRHVNDMVKDELGRPFRKYSHNQLSQLERSVQAWNRRKQHSREQSKWQTRVKPRINVEPTKETRSKGQVAAARIAQAIARVELTQRGRGRPGSWRLRPTMTAGYSQIWLSQRYRRSRISCYGAN